MSASRISKHDPERTRVSEREEEIRRPVGQLQRNDGEIPRLVALVEEGYRSYAENVHRLNVVDGLIAKRHVREQQLEGEEGGYESAQDEDESEQEEYDDEQSVTVKLGHLRIH